MNWPAWTFEIIVLAVGGALACAWIEEHIGSRWAWAWFVATMAVIALTIPGEFSWLQALSR